MDSRELLAHHNILFGTHVHAEDIELLFSNDLGVMASISASFQAKIGMA
jgi:hypothetical protein